MIQNPPAFGQEGLQIGVGHFPVSAVHSAVPPDSAPIPAGLSMGKCY